MGAIGHIHTIVILIPKDSMLTGEMMKMLSMIDEKFSESRGNMWNHVVRSLKMQ